MEHMDNNKTTGTAVKIGILILLIALFFVMSLSLGSVHIPFSEVLNVLTGKECSVCGGKEIILFSRFPRCLTALLAGAALGVSGLLMQTLFRNPLADPFVLGISSGATLGVALIIGISGLTGFSVLSGAGYIGGLSQVTAACIGSAAVFVLVMLIASSVKNNMTLLIIGMLLGYFTGSMVSIVLHFSNETQIKGFIMWTFADFSGVSWKNLTILIPLTLVFVCVAFLISKPLNVFLLGERYAKSMGVSVNRLRLVIISVASVLAAVITAFCGPIAFIGIAVPHLARTVFRSSDHRLLIPGVLLTGAVIAMAADLIARLPGLDIVLPLNAVTSLIGAPLVIYFILKKMKTRENML